MIPLVVLSLVAVLFCIFLALQVRGYYSRVSGAEEASSLTPVDLDAFQNLTDPEEDEFLRQNLQPSDFRRVQRDRIRAAKSYVAALSENAGKLAALAQAARRDPDREAAAAGVEILQRAIRLKVWCLLSMWHLNLAMVFPAAVVPSGEVANRYLAVANMVEQLPRKAAA
jgi:hypothetical protein